MTTVVVGLVTFLVGVVVGATLREAFTLARTGHTRTVPAISPLIRTRSARYLGIVLVFAALASNAAVGFLQIENGRQDRERVSCTIRYNSLEAAALDERGERGAATTSSELALWRGVLATLDPNGMDVEDLRAEIQRHVDELRESQVSRVENPYPPSDLCRVDP